MAHTASARKRLRQSKKQNFRNRTAKHAIKTHQRRVLAAIEAKDANTAMNELKVAVKRLDKAAARGVLHRNTAARTKSRLATRVAALAASKP